MRLSSIDIAKGIGIILVVTGHAWRGLYQSGLPITENVYTTLDRAIYSFHMPFFFMLSGLFFQQIIERSTALGLIKSRVVRLLWPMILWTWIFFGFKLLGGSFQNSPIAISEFPIIPIPPLLHMWFIWALFVMQITVGLGLIAVRQATQIWVPPLVLLAVVLALQLDMFADALPAALFTSAIQYAPFFILGMIIFPYIHKPVQLGPAAIALCVALALIALKAAGLLPLPKLIVAPVICLALFVAILGIAPHLLSMRIGAFLSYCGTASLAIYVMHTIFSASMRETLFAFGVTSVSVQLCLGVIAGLVGPIAFYELVKGHRAQRILGL